MESGVLRESTDKRDADAVKRNPRIRAVYRRELQHDVCFWAIATAAGIATASVIWSVAVPEAALPLAALSLPLLLAGIAIQGLVRHRGRRFAVQLGMALGLLPVLYGATAILLMWQAAPLTLGTVGAALLYLRGITRRVLVDRCGTDTGAEFWLRAADVLALAGSLILVLAFGGVLPGADWVQQLRLVLGLELAGIFVTVVLVASSVWRSLPAPNAQEAA